MSASVNILSTVEINLNDFIDFVIKQGGFINNDKEISGGFNNHDAYVWFYDLKKSLNFNEYEKSYLLEIDSYLPAKILSRIYFELSSNKDSNALMLQIAQQMSKVWAIYLDCCLYEVFTHKKLNDLIKKSVIDKNLILGNSFTLFFSNDLEDEILRFVDLNYPSVSTFSLSEKVKDFLINTENISRFITIDDLEVCFSVMYEYENEETKLTEMLSKYLEIYPQFFCEIFFGFRLNVLQEQSLLELVSGIQEITGGVGMGTFRRVLRGDEIEALTSEVFVKFS